MVGGAVIKQEGLKRGQGQLRESMFQVMTNGQCLAMSDAQVRRDKQVGWGG